SAGRSLDGVVCVRGAYSPPFVALQEIVDAAARTPEGAGPFVEEAPPLLGQLVCALRRAGLARLPARGDEAVLLERPEDPVEVAHVDTRLAGQCRQRFEELVTVSGALAPQQQQGRLGGPLDPGAHAPVAGPDHPPAACAAAAPGPHRSSTCKT